MGVHNIVGLERCKVGEAMHHGVLAGVLYLAFCILRRDTSVRPKSTVLVSLFVYLHEQSRKPHLKDNRIIHYTREWPFGRREGAGWKHEPGFGGEVKPRGVAEK